MLRKIPPAAAWGLFLAWCAGLWFISNQPATVPPAFSIPFLDKVQHFVFFAAGGFLLAFALTRSGAGRKITLTTLTVMALLGFLDEWNQLTVEGRSGGDVGDWIADVLGTAAGLGILRLVHGGEKHSGTDPRPAGRN